METLWFCIVAGMFAAYVVMDGFDFGAGVLHLWIAGSDRERREVLAAIGPFWDGNEVWLIAGGGVLFLAFPRALAAGLSGFYLAVMIVIWVLIMRGVAIEFRSHVADDMWCRFWDAVFGIASTLAPLLFGVALGNLIRGVPIGDGGWFFLTLFNSFSPDAALGLLDWYTILAGIFALAALAHHGALFLAWKTRGVVEQRAATSAARLLPAVVILWIGATAATAAVTPEIFSNLVARPAGWVCAAVLLAGLAFTTIQRRRARYLAAFLGSGAFIAGILAATAVGLYPDLIRSIDDPASSLTAFNASAGDASLAAGLRWWPVGLALVIVYVVILFRLHRGKVTVEENEGY